MPATLFRMTGLALVLVTAAACSTSRPLPPGAAIGANPSLSFFSDSLEAWTKPGLDARQFSVEEHRCYATAVDTPRTPDLYVGGLVDVARIFVEDARTSQAYYGCMARLGYRRV